MEGDNQIIFDSSHKHFYKMQVTTNLLVCQPTHRDVLLGEQQQVEEQLSLEVPPSRVQLTLIVKRVHHPQLRAGLKGREEGGGDEL